MRDISMTVTECPLHAPSLHALPWNEPDLQVMQKATAELDKSPPDEKAADKLLDEVSLLSIRGVSSFLNPTLNEFDCQIALHSRHRQSILIDRKAFALQMYGHSQNCSRYAGRPSLSRPVGVRGKPGKHAEEG